MAEQTIPFPQYQQSGVGDNVSPAAQGSDTQTISFPFTSFPSTLPGVSDWFSKAQQFVSENPGISLGLGGLLLLLVWNSHTTNQTRSHATRR